MSPLAQRRWRNFKANRRGYWSLWIFSILFVLSLFADLNDKDTDRQVRAISKVDVVPETRRVRVGGGVATARGLKVTVTLDDRVFAGSAFLLGTVLDNYFAEYVSLNQFTRTVINSLDRGEILSSKPRIGRRQVL